MATMCLFFADSDPPAKAIPEKEKQMEIFRFELQKGNGTRGGCVLALDPWWSIISTSPVAPTRYILHSVAPITAYVEII
jgi:hypothetical protein